MRIKDFEAFEARCRKLTKEFYEKNSIKDYKGMSEDAEWYADKINNGEFGGYTDSIAELFSKLIGEHIELGPTVGITGIPMPEYGVLFKIEANPNGHHYSSDEAYIKSVNKYGVSAKGAEGNNLPDNLFYIEPTEEEINTFFENFKITNEERKIVRSLPVVDIMAVEPLVEYE